MARRVLAGTSTDVSHSITSKKNCLAAAKRPQTLPRDPPTPTRPINSAADAPFCRRFRWFNMCVSRVHSCAVFRYFVLASAVYCRLASAVCCVPYSCSCFAACSRSWGRWDVVKTMDFEESVLLVPVVQYELLDNCLMC